MPVELSIGGTLSRVGMSISQRAVIGILAETERSVCRQREGLFHSLVLLECSTFSPAENYSLLPRRDLLRWSETSRNYYISTYKHAETAEDEGGCLLMLWFAWETVWLPWGGCVKETKGGRSECILRPENQTAELRGESAGRQGCWRSWCLQEVGCWGHYPALYSWLKENCPVPKCIESQIKDISTTNVFFLFVWQTLGQDYAFTASTVTLKTMQATPQHFNRTAYHLYSWFSFRL